MISKLWKRYQDAMFCAARTGDEIGKPLRFLTEFGIVILLLNSAGIKINLISQILVYLIVLVSGILIGSILIRTDTVKYCNSVANAQNPELQSILKLTKMMEEKMRKDDN